MHYITTARIFADIDCHHNGLGGEDRLGYMQCGKHSTLPCCVCKKVMTENDDRWLSPHECATFNKKNNWVCSNDCAAEWRELNWEDIEEFEYVRSERKKKEKELTEQFLADQARIFKRCLEQWNALNSD